MAVANRPIQRLLELERCRRMTENIYLLWLLLTGALIFLMQAGFFLLEGGQVRSRDAANVLKKMLGLISKGTVIHAYRRAVAEA